MLRLVIDTNIWIRILLRGRVTLPILTIWQANQFQLVTSQPLLDEYNHVWQRSRLQKYIDPQQAEKLYRQMRTRGEIVELQTIPPRCRDPKDHPVLATAIDGRANAIITGDDDLARMKNCVKLWANMVSCFGVFSPCSTRWQMTNPFHIYIWK